MEARSLRPTADIMSLRGDTGVLRFRRAQVSGIADYENELVLGGRSRAGSPGVNLLTPVRVPGSDTAVLVNRGWTYSPDAASVAPAEWREQDTVSFVGYVDVLSAGDVTPKRPGRERLIPRATLATARARLPYPVAPIYLVALEPADSAREGVPARLALPRATDEGPHLGYALQWFTFATIAFVGAGIALKRL